MQGWETKNIFAVNIQIFLWVVVAACSICFPLMIFSFGLVVSTSVRHIPFLIRLLFRNVSSILNSQETSTSIIMDIPSATVIPSTMQQNTMKHPPYGTTHRGNQLRLLGYGMVRCWRANSVLPKASMGHSLRRISNSWLDSREQQHVQHCIMPNW